jgi:hypothetical protein
VSGRYPTDTELRAEYIATAERWRAFCANGTTNRDPSGEPLAAVLLAGLCEPVAGDRFTGDIITDMLGGLRAFVQRIERDAADGGDGGLFVANDAIEVWLRRLDAVIELRQRETTAARGAVP